MSAPPVTTPPRTCTARRSIPAAFPLAAALLLLGLSAFLATLGRVGEALLVEELLLAGRPSEVPVAVGARQLLVVIFAHSLPPFVYEGSFFRGRLTRATRLFLFYSVPGGIVNRKVEP